MKRILKVIRVFLMSISIIFIFSRMLTIVFMCIVGFSSFTSSYNPSEQDTKQEETRKISTKNCDVIKIVYNWCCTQKSTD